MNFYKLESSKYNDLIEKNITKSYKKAQPETTQAIHKQNKDIATKLEIDDRVDTAANRDEFTTLEDHKPNFTNKPTGSLISPTSSEIGKVSKGILDRINSDIAKTSNFNQWKNTPSTSTSDIKTATTAAIIATCNNTKGSFKCSCKPGFTGDRNNCTDIDECAEDIHNCSKDNATCSNSKGSFNCSFNPAFRGDGYNCTVYKDCAEVYKNRHHIDEIYTIDPDGEGAFDVFCNQKGSQGGWTVFQRKSSDSIDFNRDWIAYKNGFGNLYGDFWLGLDKVHRLTKSDNYKLNLYWKMENSEVHRFRFDHFEVESEDTWYKLRVEVSGNDWGPLKDSNGQTLTTGDQDSNGHTGYTCVKKCGIGWWYNSTACHCPLGHPRSAEKSKIIIRPTSFTTPRPSSG
ncbi:ficolin-2-like [Stylophora pistillata]|uniref:ficolin-2-like n=1 Tax=Stylophora pistillata TaxID=50429 RepID=UPI000C04F3D9|nr:ficolin-2-like [Stylophora pistillata]